MVQPHFSSLALLDFATCHPAISHWKYTCLLPTCNCRLDFQMLWCIRVDTCRHCRNLTYRVPLLLCVPSTAKKQHRFLLPHIWFRHVPCLRIWSIHCAIWSRLERESAALGTLKDEKAKFYVDPAIRVQSADCQSTQFPNFGRQLQSNICSWLGNIKSS